MNGTGPRRVVRGLAAAAAAVSCALPLAGCGLFGGGVTLAAPSVMTVSSGAFVQNTLPPRFTCAGGGGGAAGGGGGGAGGDSAGGRALNPPLGWAGAPSGTKSIALVVDDSAAPITPYVYWIVFDISPATSAILEGQVPPGARQARNSTGQAGYDPPCPGPHGHAYRFTVYALNSMLNLPPGTSLQSAWTAIAAATIGRGRMTVTAAP